MQSARLENESYRFQSLRQQRIYQRFFGLLGAGSATLYRDACILIEPQTRIDSKVHLVSHLFRELEAQLRSLLVDPGQLEALKADKALSATRETAKTLKAAGIPDDDPLVKACQDFATQVARTSHREEISNVLKQLDISTDHPVAVSWFKLIGAERLPKYAHHRVLGRIRTWDDTFENIIQSWEEVFDFLLERFQGKYETYHKRLDALLQKEIPEDEDIKLLRFSVPNNIHAMHYFFERNDKPGWLLRLSKEGFFAGPQEPEPDPETGDRIYPRWPAGSYLIRMAKHKPREVIDILLAVNDKLNPYVQWALIEAATQMPPREAARIVPNVKQWLQTKRDRLLIPDCVKLVVYLAEGRCFEETIELMQELFLVPDGSADSLFAADNLAWDYDNALKKVAPRLIDALGLQALTLFCDLLDQALRASLRYSIGEDGSDHSYSWRARIEQNPDRDSHDIRNVFTTAVRDCAVRLARNNSHLLASIVGVLEGRSWLIFHRLALHLVCEFPDQSLELICSRLKEFHRYDDPHFYNEYFRLARIAFPMLRDNDREEILTSIQTGPDVSTSPSRLDESGEETVADSLQRRIREEIRDSLGELRLFLDETRMSFLEELEADLGPSVPKVMPRPDYDAWGHLEPEETLEWDTATVEEIVSFLHNWGPCTDAPRRSPDRTSKRLLRATSSAPEKFAGEALRFTQVDPTYLTHLLRGFKLALEAKPLRAFEWDQVLALCSWVVSKGRDIPGRTVETFCWDRDWGYARREIVDLVDAGLTICPGGIPFHLRDQVWSVVEPLTADPEPTMEDERHFSGGIHAPLSSAGEKQFVDLGMSPGDMAINKVRCLAITAMISYALWVRQSLPQHEMDENGFVVMPEVRKVLEYHLDYHHDSSIAVAYVYGKHIYDLYKLDQSWVRDNKARIFSRSEGQRVRGAAAWEGYLMHWHASSKFFDVLQEQYEQAVAELGKTTTAPEYGVNPDLRLGEHLYKLYLWGKILLDSPTSLFELFFQKAGDKVVGRLVSSVGSALYQESALPAKTLGKLRTLWEWRLTRIRAEDDLIVHTDELRAFGAWFGSGRFDDSWALERLREVLELNGHPRDGKGIVKRLSNLVNQFPIEVLDCAIILCRDVDRDAMIYYWRDELNRIIAAARNSDDHEVQLHCKELTSILLSKGFTEFD